jgi:PEP-CTERM motif
MRAKILLVVANFAIFGMTAAPAQAGLVGDGTNTVEASFWMPVIGGPTTTSPPPGPCTTSLPCEIPNFLPGGSTNFPLPTVPVDFAVGATSESTISVGDTQIVITNQEAVPFCSTTLPCSDPFVGFQFIFSSGVDIKGVSVDPASAADFRPNDTAPHNGLELLSPTRIVVDVTSDLPAVGDKLILDLTFPSVGPAVPEPSTWALMLLGFAGLGFAGWRRMAAAQAA